MHPLRFIALIVLESVNQQPEVATGSETVKTLHPATVQILKIYINVNED